MGTIYLHYNYIVEDWDTLPENLKLLDKELGRGRFGNVQQGLLTVNEEKSLLVAVKTVKGTYYCTLLVLEIHFDFKVE